MQDNKLHMVVKQGGKTYIAISTKPLPDSYEVTARLRKNGAMSIEVDGQSTAKGNAPGLFKQALSQGLRVGMDYNNEDRMGTYEGSFGFSGDMKNTFLELNKPGQTPTLLANKVNKSSGTAKKTGVTTILLKVKEHAMQYDKKTFTVKAGETIDIVFENPDFMQHNVVITRPGMLEKVGAAADVLARDPKGAEKNYVPEMSEVLYATKLVDPNGRVTLRFTAPDKAGDYPYVCTFPGHWRIMNGIMKVVEEKI
jgi:azurin